MLASSDTLHNPRAQLAWRGLEAMCEPVVQGDVRAVRRLLTNTTSSMTKVQLVHLAWQEKQKICAQWLWGWLTPIERCAALDAISADPGSTAPPSHWWRGSEPSAWDTELDRNLNRGRLDWLERVYPHMTPAFQDIMAERAGKLGLVIAARTRSLLQAGLGEVPHALPRNHRRL